MTWTSVSRLSRPIISTMARLWPWATSQTMTSTPASIRVRARLYASSPKPIAAATRSRPESSLVASGNCSLLVKSLTVIRPRSRPSASTSGSFSILCRRSSSSASGLLTPTGAVISGVRVITSRTRVSGSVTKRMSRLVMMPTRVPAASVTGRPEMRNLPQRMSTSRTVSSGEQVTGLVIMPDSERLTRSTWCAWSSMERLRCSTPMPPCRAMAIAIRASVTVSIALESTGRAMSISRVSRVRVSMSLGAMSDSAGWSSTSSKVSPSGITRAEPDGISGMYPARSSCPAPVCEAAVGDFSTDDSPELVDGHQHGARTREAAPGRRRYFIVLTWPVASGDRRSGAPPARPAAG